MTTTCRRAIGLGALVALSVWPPSLSGQADQALSEPLRSFRRALVRGVVRGQGHVAIKAFDAVGVALRPSGTPSVTFFERARVGTEGLVARVSIPSMIVVQDGQDEGHSWPAFREVYAQALRAAMFDVILDESADLTYDVVTVVLSPAVPGGSGANAGSTAAACLTVTADLIDAVRHGRTTRVQAARALDTSCTGVFD